jgi:hypothetical protein
LVSCVGLVESVGFTWAICVQNDVQ